MVLIKALEYIQKELSVIPVLDKRPSLPSWRPFQTQLMTQDQVKYYFRNATGIAIICGFKGLETLDFDDAKAYTQFARTIQAEHFSLFKTLSIARTPRPGYHIRYLCPEKEISGNQVLARNCNGKPQIESRGTGGYAVAPPTDGYRWFQGDEDSIPTITAKDRNCLLATAKSLCQSTTKIEPNLQVVKKFSYRTNNTPRIGDLYNQSNQYRELMEELNLRLFRVFDDKEYWVWRDAKERNNSVTFFTKIRLFYVHTTNLYPFKSSDRPNPFGLLAKAKFNGDFSLAAAYLRYKNPAWKNWTTVCQLSEAEKRADLE